MENERGRERERQRETERWRERRTEREKDREVWDRSQQALGGVRCVTVKTQ